MPMITNLLLIELAVLVFVAGLVAIAGVVYLLTRKDIKKADRTKWLTTLTKAVIAIITAMSGGAALLVASRFFGIGPSG